MKKWLGISVLTLAVLAFAAPVSNHAADKKYTIALIPGLTTDAFYITMHKGAQLRPTPWASISSFKARRNLTRFSRCRF
jgi:hypothetical protein